MRKLRKCKTLEAGGWPGEEETWYQYWTWRRLWVVSLEAVFAVVFFRGLYVLSWGVEDGPMFIKSFYGFGFNPYYGIDAEYDREMDKEWADKLKAREEEKAQEKYKKKK